VPPTVTSKIGGLRRGVSSITYDPATQKLSHEPNAEKQAKAELLDGCYLLWTDLSDLSA
jgi:hypothetical protein